MAAKWRNKVCKTFLFNCHVLPLANYQKIKVYRLEMAETDSHLLSSTPCRDLRGIPLTLNRSSCEKHTFINLDNIHCSMTKEKLNSPARVRITGLERLDLTPDMKAKPISWSPRLPNVPWSWQVDKSDSDSRACRRSWSLVWGWSCWSDHSYIEDEQWWTALESGCTY